MTLKIIIRQKGGSGSGNHGHGGRPGKVGGSAGKKGPSAEELARSDKYLLGRVRRSYAALGHADEMVERAKAIWEQSTGGKIPLGTFIQSSYDFEDPVSGLRTEVKEVNVQDLTREGYDGTTPTIVIQSHVFAPDLKNKVGEMTRYIYADGEIHNDYFYLDKWQQGNGFGSAVYRHQEEIAMAAGIKRITTYANITVGGYAWARMGFDFADDATRKDMVDSFTAMWKEGYSPHPVPPIYHAWEMAAATSPGGYPFGKDFMMDHSWNAVKILDPTDTGVQVGRAYYAAKDKKKEKQQ